MNEFQFGQQVVRTKVNMMTAPEREAVSVDVMDFMALDAETDGEAPRPGAPDVAALSVWED